MYITIYFLQGNNCVEATNSNSRDIFVSKIEQLSIYFIGDSFYDHIVLQGCK